MARAVRVLAVAAVLLAAGAVAVAVLLPRLVDRPEVRSRIEMAVTEATGRSLTYESLSAGFLPPAIMVKGPSLAGARPGEPPLFAADRVSLRVELLPLLGRAVVIDRLRIDGARVHLVRVPEARGESAPSRDAGSGAASPSPPTALTAPGQGASGVPFGVRAIDAAGATITVEDRGVSPTVTHVLEDVQVTLRAAGVGEPARFSGTMRAASGGTVVAEGTVTAGGDLAADVALERIEAAPLTAYLGDGRSVSGLVGGSVRLEGPAAAPAKIGAKLVAEDASVDLGNVQLRGRLSVTGDLTRTGDGFGGPFEIDATEAELAYGNAFRKPPGTGATTSGILRPRKGGGFDVDELRVRIKNFEAHGAVRSSPKREATLAAEPFDLAGWEALLPRLGGRPLTGTLGIDARAGDLDASPAGLLSAAGRDIDVGAFTERISGPLRFDARLDAPLGSVQPLVDTVSGTVDFVLGPGTAKGFSVVRDGLERSGSLLDAVLAAGKAFGGRDVQRLYGDGYERIAGKLRLGGGLARFDPLEAVYREYRADLRGSVRLVDRALDAKGEIFFADAEGAGALRGQTIRIAHLGGTLDRPRVELSAEDVARVAAGAARPTLERKLAPLLDRLQGDKDGKSPLGALQELLQGRKRN